MNESNTPNETPRELEERANEKRSEINRTLSQIESQFSPSQLIDQAMGLFRDNGGEMANNLGRTVRDNPVPMILTGVGLAWMALSQNSTRSRAYDRGHDDYYRNQDDRYGRYAGSGYRDNDNQRYSESSAYRQSGETYETGSDSYHPSQNFSSGSSAYSDDRVHSGSTSANSTGQDDQSLIDKAKEAGRDALDTLADVKDEAGYRYREEAARARHAAQDWRGRADGQMQDLRSSVRSTADDASRFMREQPLVVGAAGIAFGAFIGALLPPTRVEDRLAGKQSDAITDDVEHMADEKLKQGASAAREHMQKAAGEIRESASDALKKADSKIDSTVDSSTGTKSDSTSGSTRGADAGSPAGAKTGSTTGANAGSNAGSTTGASVGSSAGSTAGANVGSNAGSKVGSDADSRVGSASKKPSSTV